MSKTKKKFTVEARVAVLSQCPDAMQFIEHREIPVSQIREEMNGNSARAAGFSNDHIKKFENLIRSGKYSPYHNIPPVVTPLPVGDRRRLNDKGEEQYLYLLVAGHHRFQAHVLIDEPIFYAQVVKFKAAGGKTALHWHRLYQIKENLPEDEEYIRNTATPDDIAGSVVELINIERSTNANHPSVDTMITNFLKSLDIVATGKVKTITNMVHRKLGNLSKVVQGLTDKVRERYKNMFIANNKKDPDNVIYSNFVPGDKNVEDYDYRSISKVWDRIDADPKSINHIAIVAGTTKANHMEIKQVRKKKAALYKNWADKVINQAAFLLGVSPETLFALKKGKNYEKFISIPINWMPQLHGESDKVKESGELITVVTRD